MIWKTLDLLYLRKENIYKTTVIWMNGISETLPQIYIILSINSFLVLIDQLIELSKSKKFEKDDLNNLELNLDEIKSVSSIGISLITLLVELTILIFLKSLLIFIIISIILILILIIFIVKHSKLKKLKIFKINHWIFDLLLILKFIMLYITIKFLIR